MNTYNPADLQKKPKKEKVPKEKMKKETKGEKKTPNYGFIMFLAVMVFLLGFCIIENVDLKYSNSLSVDGSDAYIGVLEVHGMMTSDGSDPAYDQKWLLEQIDDMMHDSNNKGLIVSIDTPGGSVYTVDELYLKIKAYQKQTMRPVYAYMESMAASGGYYIAAPAEKIYANRNCWTGSIGVTIGTIYDITEFLEDLGVTTVTITAGDNKAMGSPTEKLTEEQQDIYQSLVDEAYDQFVDIVAEGRDMSVKRAKELADGRLYTAKQAAENGLVDAVGTREEAIAAMIEDNGLSECETVVLSYEPEFSLGGWLLGMTQQRSESASGEYAQIMQMMAENNKFTISYLSQIKK